MTDLFNSKAPWIMNLLRADFGLSIEEAAAILGNIGHECGGFKLFQEQKPLVPGSRGGFGWCQWTGPRRVAFENYCKRNGLDPKSDKANYGWLYVELKSTESAAIPAVKRAVGLEAKVRAFELKFERAGVKHYDSRYVWARRALAAHAANPHAKAPYMAALPTPYPDGDIVKVEVDGVKPTDPVPPELLIPAESGEGSWLPDILIGVGIIAAIVVGLIIIL